MPNERRNRIANGIAFLTHLVLFALGPALLTGTARDFDCRGNQFIPFKDFSSFAQSPGERTNEIMLLSPQITAGINWNELIVSWNAKLSDSSYLKLEVRAIYQDRATKYYTMAFWSGNPARNPRASTPHQKDADGDVSTDTLILKEPCDRLQIKLTTGGESEEMPKLKFLGLCLSDTKAAVLALSPNRHAWGKILPVPERSQMI